MKSRLLILLFVLPLMLRAQQPYDTRLIQASMKENANVVKRMEEVQVRIKDKGKAVISRRYALTILNESADEAAVFGEHYSKLIDLKSIDGTLFDASGNKIRSLKKSEIKDISDTDESSLADDSRAKIHDFGYHSYPYTVEYEYNLVLDGLFSLNTWRPVEQTFMSVEQSNIRVVFPADYELRYKSFNLPSEPVASSSGKETILSWEIKSYPAIKPEKNMEPWHAVTPMLYLAPSDFSFQGYDGSMRTWKEFGSFIYQLNTGRDILPDPVKQEVHRLADGLTDPHEKLKVLYQYLQKNTRYISIQLGIGGWQTFDAKYVASKGYGDCKALTNYMHSILKEVGINSFYTLIRAGRDHPDILSDFPSNQFNHIILCALAGQDTTWLECTSSTEPAGYLGGFTSDRYALLVDEQGGRLVRTPRYSESDNQQIRILEGTLLDDGQLQLKVNATYRAEQYDMMEKMLYLPTREKQLDELKEMLSLPSFEAREISYTAEKRVLPEIHEQLSLTVKNYASVTGKRLFIVPNVMNRTTIKLNEKEKRTHRIFLGSAYTDIDSVKIRIPAGYRLESLPSSVNTQTTFGYFQTQCEVTQGMILYSRKLIKKAGIFDASEYTAWASFQNLIYKSDREQIVLVKE